MSTGAVPEVLSTEDQEFFAREGYVMLPGFLDKAFNKRLKGDVDRLMKDREEQRASHIVSYRDLGLLTSHPPLIEMLKEEKLAEAREKAARREPLHAKDTLPKAERRRARRDGRDGKGGHTGTNCHAPVVRSDQR